MHNLIQTSPDNPPLILSSDCLPHTWRTRQAGTLAATTVITLSLFSWLAPTTTSGTGLASHDRSVTARAVDERHPVLTVIMQVSTALGSTVRLTILTTICTVLLFMRNHRVRALVLNLMMIGSSLLTVALKEIFGRAHPSVDTLLGESALTTSSPLGHFFGMAVLAGTLTGMALTSTTVALYRTLVIMAAVGVTLLVGASHVYLDYHWITDVLADQPPGLAWLCLVTLTLLWLKERRRQPPSLATTPSNRPSGVEGIEPPPI